MSKPAVFIRPEHVMIGDIIRIEQPNVLGVAITFTGQVARRKYEGSDRVLYTPEGGRLLTWNPNAKRPTIYLLDRPPAHAEVPLFTDSDMADIERYI